MSQGYKWIALSNTTLGVLMVTINQSIAACALAAVASLLRGGKYHWTEPEQRPARRGSVALEEVA